ncbi:MAG TPA: hypothetical protein VKT77_00305 [Chthonomonadaceae bacterium]|nr:hypothetical protein [Chthonomonadaceae bacterium]
MERYTYQWRDFQVNLYLTRRPHIARQVHSFLEYAAALAQAQGATLDQEFIRRVRSTRIIIGYDAGPNYLEHSRFQRLETILVALRDITGSLLHWEGAIYDQDGRLLIA